MSLARKASLALLLLVLPLPSLALSRGDLKRELLKVYDGLLRAERKGAAYRKYAYHKLANLRTAK